MGARTRLRVTLKTESGFIRSMNTLQMTHQIMSDEWPLECRVNCLHQQQIHGFDW